MMHRLILTFVLAVLLWPTPSWATRLFTTGFEENCLTTCMWTSTTGNAPTIGSGSPHSGTYELNTSVIAGNSYVTLLLATAKTTGTITQEFSFKSSTATPSAQSVLFSNLSLQLSLTTSGAIELKNLAPGTPTSTTSSTPLTAATYYNIAYEHVIADSGGTMTAKIYNDNTHTLLETLVLDGVAHAGEDTLLTNVQTFRFGKTASTAVFSYDDIRINDQTGSSQTTWPGPGKIYMLVPDSNVTMTWKSNSGGDASAVFSTINELPGTIDDTTYNQANDTATANVVGTDIDRLGLTNLDGTVPSDATMTLVAVYGRCGSTQTSATHLQYKLYDDVSALTSGPTVNCNVNGITHLTATNESLNLDVTGKSKAQLDSFNVGYEAITDTITLRPRRISALWVNVEWTEAAAAASVLQPAGGFLGTIIR